MRHPARLASLFAVALLSAAAAPTTAPTSQPTTGPSAAAVDWSEAAKHAGETVTVTGPVMGVHVSGANVVLNVGKDFPDDDRFCIMLPFDAAKGSPEDQFVGKTATVTGPVKKYRKVFEIVAKSAADVTLSGK